MKHQCAVDLLDHLPLGLRDEVISLVVRVAADTFDGNRHRESPRGSLQAKLKRLISRGILAETQAPLFIQSRPDKAPPE